MTTAAEPTPPDTTVRLTNEQRALAAANVYLIPWFLRLPKVQGLVRLLGQEESYSVAALAFVQAIPLWDPARGKLSTHLTWKLWGALTYAARRARRNPTQSLGEVQAERLAAPQERQGAGLDVDTILSGLPEDDRQLLVEAFVLERSHVAMARDRGYTPEGLGARIARLRRQIDRERRHRFK